MSALIRTSMTVLLLAQVNAVAQKRPATFETASLKRWPTTRYIHPAITPQGFHIAAPLYETILWAYDIQSYQTSAAPPWLRLNGDFYEIEAVTRGPATVQEMRTMLQALLADRLNLRVHRESKDMSVYALVIAKNGPNLASSDDICGTGGCIDIGPGELIAR